MIIDLNKDKVLLTDLLQNGYTDMDIYREEPITFRDKNLMLVVKPVEFMKHDVLLNDMAKLITRYNNIFAQIDELNAYNYDNKDAVKELINKIGLFSTGKYYRNFKKDAFNFVCKWAYTGKVQKVVNLKRSKRQAKKFLSYVEPSTFIHILFLLFVFNFDIVKKNTIEFMKMFQEESGKKGSQRSGMSSQPSKNKAAVMPKYSTRPFNKLTLDLLEKQSEMN
jgi:hypothetical protein